MSAPLPLPGPGRWARTTAPLLHPIRTLGGLLEDGPVSVLIILFNLLADVAYAYMDPRVRFDRR